MLFSGLIYRIAWGADLLDLLVQPSREAAECAAEAMIAVSKHDKCRDLGIEARRDILRSGVHHTRALRVSDQGKLLARASGSLGFQSIDDIPGALSCTRDDGRACGILHRFRSRSNDLPAKEGRTNLDGITSRPGQENRSIANNRVANNDTELAAAGFVVWLTGAASLISRKSALYPNFCVQRLTN
jgi:hypothetical protein